MNKLLSLVVALSFILMPWKQSYALDLVGENGKKFAGAVKEVFLKGSIDGQSLFLVYGMGDMSKDLRHQMERTGTMFKRDVIELGKLFNNSDHHQDYVEALRDGAKVTTAAAGWVPDGMKNAVKWPWRSLKKIPGSYKMDIEKARDAYYNSENSIAGVVRYSGWAVWANVKGAYYLIVEAPMGAVGGLLQTTAGVIGTTLAVPTVFVLQTLSIALKATFTALKVVFNGVVMTGQVIYSAISSTTATLATVTVAGSVLLYKGGKWLFVDSFQLLTKPVRAKLKTEIDVLAQSDYAARLQEALKGIQWRIAGVELKSKIGKYKSSFEFRKDGKKLYTITTDIKSKLVVLEAATSQKFFRMLRKLPEFKDQKKREVKAALKAELEKILLQLSEA